MRAVDLADIDWAVARVWVYGEMLIRIGPLNGRHGWVAQRLGHRKWVGCWIAADERAACSAVESWMRRRGGCGVWRELQRPGVAGSADG